MNDCCASKSDIGTGYDLAVIGAGSVGFSAAITAAGAVGLTAWLARTGNVLIPALIFCAGMIGYSLYRNQRPER
jgi:thioredoxin reductase